MLMWVLILALYGAAIAVWGTNLRQTLKVRILACSGTSGGRLYLFILLTSNPLTGYFAPLDGRGLNPLLQDPGLAFHPPLLYLGYVGFSTTFSFAVAALIEGRWILPGAMGSSLGACRMGLSNCWNCARLLVGLLRLGWAAGGFGIRWRMHLLCLGLWAPHYSIRPSCRRKGIR